MKVSVDFCRNILSNIRSKGRRVKMQEFDKISIAEISKKDMLMIIEALEYTGKNTNIDSFLKLRNNIIKELSELADSTEDEFIQYLKK
ncbi:hypothetical protein [Caloranaerobacter ferrireducens]|nr:hypothetical protein [Caloranaerobacter ferrireducens]